MANINIGTIQNHGALRSGFGVYHLGGGFSGSIRYGISGLGAGCPEGAKPGADGNCECYPGRVWLSDRSRCVSPESLAYTGAITIEEAMAGTTSDTFGQQELTAAARRVIEQAGYTIDCKIDDSWFAGPQGGQPSRVCSINGSPYMFGAYALNLNPRGGITDYNQWLAAQKIEQATGIPSGALRSTPETTALLQATASSGVVSDQGAKLAIESIAKLNARGIPQWGILPTGQYPQNDAVQTQVLPTGTAPQPGETPMATAGPIAPLGPSPYTGGWYEGPPAGSWTPPPYGYRGEPTLANGVGGSAENSAAAFDFDSVPMWAWIAAAAGGFFLLNK